MASISAHRASDRSARDTPDTPDLIRRVRCGLESPGVVLGRVGSLGRAARVLVVAAAVLGSHWGRRGSASRACWGGSRRGLASDVEHGRVPARLWVRRLRGYGFMYHAQVYRRVLMVATGAGIGPMLPYLLGRPPVRFECLWIGRHHRTAMGTDLVDRVLAGGSVTLLDTSQRRPDVGACVVGVANG